MNKKLLSIVLVITLIVGLIPGFVLNAFAEDTNSIQIRVEGKDDTLFNRQVSVTDEVYGFDVLINALGEGNIDHTYWEGWGSEFVNDLFEEGGETGTGFSTGWSYYTKSGDIVEYPMVAINNYNIENTDELVYYVSASDSAWNPLTIVPEISIANNGNSYEITVEKSVYNNETGNTDLVPVQGVDIEVSYLDPMISDANGKVIFEVGDGIYDVTISKTGQYPEIVRQHLVIEGGESSTIKNAVDSLKDYYNRDGQYSFREAVSLNHTGEYVSELKNINSKFKINEAQSASAYAGNIIGLIASCDDPENCNGVNYVEMLAGSQVEEGDEGAEAHEVGKFLIGQYDDWPTTVAYSILALDMAGAAYNVEDAVTALMNYASGGNYGDVDTTAMSIMALANHTDIDGVQALIDSCIEYLKSQQLASGGFESWGAENPYSISAVIQALVANNINPLSEDWIKNGNTMLDAMMAFWVNDHFEYTYKLDENTTVTDINSATEQAFTALADLYRGKSMFRSVKKCVRHFNEDFSVTRVGSGSFSKGEEAKLQVSITNNTAASSQTTFIVVLYNTDEGRMETYTYLTAAIGSGDTQNIAGALLIPESGNYEIRGFLWDNIDNMNVLAQPVVVDVQ